MTSLSHEPESALRVTEKKKNDKRRPCLKLFIVVVQQKWYNHRHFTVVDNNFS